MLQQEFLTDTEQFYRIRVKDVDGTETATWQIDKSVDEFDESRTYQLTELTVWEGRVYECITATSAGEDPTDTSAKWLQITYAASELEGQGYVKRANVGILDIPGAENSVVDNSISITTTSLVGIGFFNNNTTSAEVQVSFERISGSITDLTGTTFTIDLGGVSQTFTATGNSGVFTLNYTGLTVADNQLLRISKSTEGTIAMHISIVIDHSDDVIIKPAVITALDGEFTTNDELTSAVANIHNVTNITENFINVNAEDYVRFKVYADNADIKFQKHYYKRNSSQPTPFKGAWVQPVTPNNYVDGDLVTYLGEYWVAIRGGQDAADEGAPDVVEDGVGEKLWERSEVSPANDGNQWDLVGTFDAFTWADYASGGLFISETTESNGSTTIKLQFGGSSTFVYRNIVADPYTDIIYKDAGISNEITRRGD